MSTISPSPNNGTHIAILISTKKVSRKNKDFKIRYCPRNGQLSGIYMKNISITTFILLLSILSTDCHAGFFDIFESNPYKKFEENMPVYFPREDDGKCIHFYLINDEKRQNFVVTNTRNNTASLEANYCERMFAKSIHAYLSSPNKGIPAKDLIKDEAEILAATQIKPIKWYKSTGKGYFTTQVSNDKNLRKGSIEDQHIMREGTPFGRKRMYDIYRPLEPFHKSYWQNGDRFFVNNEFLEQATDWEEILDLNLRAKILWDDLVEHAPFSKDIPKEDFARVAYYSGKIFSKDKKINKALIKQIRIYKKSVKAFLESSPIFETGGLGLIKSYHPFFIQTLFEHFANFRAFFEKEEFDHNDKNNMEDIFNAMFIFDKSLVMEDFNFVIPKYYQSPLSMDAHGFKRVLSSLILLNQVQDGCNVWGLWPGLTRFLTDFYKFNYGDYYFNNPISYLFNNLKVKIRKECGSLSPYTSFNFWAGGPLSSWENGLKKKNKDTVKIYNELYERYSK